MPYAATSIADIYAELATRDPEDIRRAVPDIDPALAAVVMRCLERDASKRFADARELGAALEACVKTAGNDVLSSLPVAPTDTPPTIRDEAPKKRSRAPMIALAALGASGLVAVGVFLATRHPGPTMIDAAIVEASVVEASATADAEGIVVVPPDADTTTTPIDAGKTTHDGGIRVRDAGRITKPPCNPPYYFDAKGTKVFRAECLP